jgi:purine-binding chemotaxis protein CheW
VTFALSGEEFGVPIEFVKEIVRVPDISRVPMVPSYIDGIANLRGSVLPIVSLRKRFGLAEEERTDDNRVVVVENGGRLVGLVVDQVSEVIRIPDDSIEMPPPVLTTTLDAQYLQGVAKLDEGKRLVLLLEIDCVIPSDADSDRAIAAAASVGLSGASAAAKATSSTRQAVAEEQVVGFRLGGEEFAVGIADVQEIIRVPEINQVPSAPSYVEGLIALRNRLLPIVNLRKRFGMDAGEIDREENRILVISVRGQVTGFLVDEVSEVLSMPVTAIGETPAIIASSQADRLRGVAQLDDGKRLMMLLDAGKVLSSTEAKDLKAMGRDDGKQSTAASHEALDEEQFVSFLVENEEFAVDIQQVQEIIRMTDITRVPQTPDYVEGMINLRGSVLPVLDMRKRFGIAAKEADDATSILVVDVDGEKTGVIVDDVREVLRLNRSAIEPPPPVIAGVDAAFIRGVGKRGAGKRMLILLDLQQVVRVEPAA